jgi:histidine decarboxylase
VLGSTALERKFTWVMDERRHVSNALSPGAALDAFSGNMGKLFEIQRTNIGYPANPAYDYAEFAKKMSGAFSLKMNNVGYVDDDGLYAVNSKDVEKSVMRYFYDLWGFDIDRVWGYVTASGTDGNLQALFVARELLPDAILYFSKDSHYSIKKIAKILRLSFEEVDSLQSGEMDCTDFERRLKKNGDVFSAIVSANLGTTMKGAYDDVEKIRDILKKNGKEGRCFVHADAALMGFVLPLAKDVSFKRSVHSIAVSGHKFPGVPFPCGLVAIDTNVHGKGGRSLSSIGNFVEYVDCMDCTISGSRSSVSPLFLAHIIAKKGEDGFRADFEECLSRAELLVNELQSIGIDAWRNNMSITVVFPRPSERIVRKWQLASQDGLSHVVMMPHVDEALVDEFIADLKSAQ